MDTQFPNLHKYDCCSYRDEFDGYRNPDIIREFAFWVNSHQSLEDKSKIYVIGPPTSGLVLATALCLLDHKYIIINPEKHLHLSPMNLKYKEHIIIVDDHIEMGSTLDNILDHAISPINEIFVISSSYRWEVPLNITANIFKD